MMKPMEEFWKKELAELLQAAPRRSH